MAVAFGREIARLEKHDPQRAMHQADMLEVWLRFALFAIVGDLARLDADGEDHDAYHADLQYLRQIAASLAVLAMLCAKISRACSGRLGFAGVSKRSEVNQDGKPLGALHPDMIRVHCTLQAHAFPNLAFIDSG